jgi:hypothetical protein
MTRSAISADFNKLVKRIKTIFPQETAGIFFVNLSGRHWEKRLTHAFRRVDESLSPGIIRSCSAPKDLICMATGWDAGIYQNRIFMSRMHGLQNPVLPAAEEKRDMLYGFYHETFHVLWKKKERDQPHLRLRRERNAEKADILRGLLSFKGTEETYLTYKNAEEAAADVFACAVGLKEGWLGLDHVRQIADWRRGNTLDYKHQTQNALDALAHDHVEGRFNGWSLRRLKNFAVRHAGLYAASWPEIKKVRDRYDTALW